MVELTDSESKLVTQLLEQLDQVVDELPEVDPEYANKTKIQKLLYFAIDAFDLPITHSWYLAGAVVPDRSIGPGTFANADQYPTGPSGPTLAGEDTQENSASDDTSADEPLDPILFGGTSGEAAEPEDDLSVYVSREQLLDFYHKTIPEVWHEQTMRFLQNFYHETAPEEYRLLYIESTHIRTNLADLTDTLRSHLVGESPVRSTGDLRRSIELSISDYHYYLRQQDTPEIEITFGRTVEATNLLEDALLMIDQTPPEEYTEQHLQCLEDLQEFFFYCVWKYPCLLISQETATGPSAAELRAEHAAEFATFDETIQQRQSEMAKSLSDADLLPGPDDYPPFENDELAETLTDMSTAYFE